jgi:transcriptional regulator with XRE-family HTH domain
MIKNEREYRITKSQVASFRKALESLRAETLEGEDKLLAMELQEAALRSQLEELEEQVAQYETLLNTRPQEILTSSIEELPTALIKARIASGLTQADLARQLGFSEQQIQRYEATDYSGASLKRIKQIADALRLRIEPRIFVEQSSISLSGMFRKLGTTGLTRDFIEKWILSPNMREQTSSNETDFAVSTIASRIGRVFGWSEANLLGPAPLSFNTEILDAVRHKKPKKVDEQKVNALTVYAHYLSLLTLSATEHLQTKAIPQVAREFREELVHAQGSVGFREAVNYVWDLGIPILPLAIGGSLHGAMWRVNRRNIIVLKQSTRFTGRWLIDLLHEIDHAKEDLDKPDKAVIETEDPLMSRNNRSEAEVSATEFAIDVALNGRAEMLFELCVNEAKGKVEWLKRVVPEVAKRERVDQGVLANALAYRLSEQKINWWGAAAGLQDSSQDPWAIARDAFLERANLRVLNPIDREILLQSLTESL